ncbi:unnamed protein product [Amaranthus hypochondriacus]
MAASASESFKDYPSPALKLEELQKKVGETENSNPIDLVYFRDDDLDLIPYQGYCFATPLLELSYLSLCSDYFQTISFNSYTNPFPSLQDLIHVTIKVIDNDKRDFILFDSDTCDARSMAFFGYRLNICLEKSKLNRPVWIPKYLYLKLCIEDKSTRSEIIEIFPLKVERKVVYDTQRFLELFGTSYKHVQVYYTYFRYAMIASVDCCVLKNDDIGVESEDRCVKVSGAISARFKVRDKVITRFLLNEQEGNIEIFDPAALRWSSSFAVPAYSSLEIVVDDMVVNQEKIDTSGHPLIFEPISNHKEKVEIVGPKWRFLVTMKWKHAYKSLPTLCECDLSDEAEGSSEESTDSLEFEGGCVVSELIEDGSRRDREKRLRLQLVEPPRSDVDVIMKRSDPEPAYHYHPLNLVEVFSICVCPYVENDDCSFILGGTVKMFDFWGTHEVFNGDKQPSRLYPHQTLPMVEPPGCYQGAYIRLEFDLNDEQGRQLSHGFFSWNFHGLRMWYDRRMCSIVHGKDGFAAVHYTVFSDAAQAVVRISFASTKDHEYQVCGRIWGRYSGYRYHTQYDRRYYQSPLFEKAKDYVALKNNEELPLLKRVVSVPTDDMLVVVVNLNVVVGGRKEILKLKGKVKFKSREKTSEYETKSIETSDYKLVVSVRWG